MLIFFTNKLNVELVHIYVLITERARVVTMRNTVMQKKENLFLITKKKIQWFVIHLVDILF